MGRCEHDHARRPKLLRGRWTLHERTRHQRTLQIGASAATTVEDESSRSRAWHRSPVSGLAWHRRRSIAAAYRCTDGGTHGSSVGARGSIRGGGGNHGCSRVGGGTKMGGRGGAQGTVVCTGLGAPGAGTPGGWYGRGYERTPRRFAARSVGKRLPRRHVGPFDRFARGAQVALLPNLGGGAALRDLKQQLLALREKRTTEPLPLLRRPLPRLRHLC